MHTQSQAADNQMKGNASETHYAVQDIGLDFPASECGTRDALVEIGRRLHAHITDNAAIEKAELVLAEVLNNVVEHAYSSCEIGSVSLDINIGEDHLKFRVRDTGLAMRTLVLHSGGQASPDMPRKDLPEGGFGWFLIRSLSHEIMYCRQNNTNQLSFTINLGSKPKYF